MASMKRLSQVCTSAFTATVFLSLPVSAQTWPTRPLTLVVPFAAGGPSDVAGRIIAQRMSELLGQQVVVENPSGSGRYTRFESSCKVRAGWIPICDRQHWCSCVESIALQEAALRYTRRLSC